MIRDFAMSFAADVLTGRPPSFNWQPVKVAFCSQHSSPGTLLNSRVKECTLGQDLAANQQQRFKAHNQVWIDSHIRLSHTSRQTSTTSCIGVSLLVDTHVRLAAFSY